MVTNIINIAKNRAKTAELTLINGDIITEIAGNVCARRQYNTTCCGSKMFLKTGSIDIFAFLKQFCLHV